MAFWFAGGWFLAHYEHGFGPGWVFGWLQAEPGVVFSRVRRWVWMAFWLAGAWSSAHCEGEFGTIWSFGWLGVVFSPSLRWVWACMGFWLAGAGFQLTVKVGLGLDGILAGWGLFLAHCEGGFGPVWGFSWLGVVFSLL
jgi:hypothetical protein